ncbi:hypothetical protein [Streptomyces capitiformicae]|uniref:Uncharacterized protein n=1 Tax=Streptomyces capitiformicae TaxID=2014920 RepID=A0A919DG43_9ACTN|nr:hypothetical protein [Streptomyces capitiformicae]GHE42294.1 hypothetical protein GCM10017771_61910 [Streptomyces capitiformicae]
MMRAELAELVEIRGALTKLRGALDALRLVQGDSPYVRRLANDLDRFQLDLEDDAESQGSLASMAASVATMTSMAVANIGRDAARDVARDAARDVVLIKEASDHDAPWHDADDEGIGGHRR